MKCPHCGHEHEFSSSREPCPHCSKSGLADDVQAAAQRLAEDHYRLQPEITEIRTIVASGAYPAVAPNTIRLLEVNTMIPASGVAIPLGFKAMPASGIPYPSVIVSVTPEEYEQIKIGEMALPAGWNLNHSIQIFKPTDNGEE